MLNVIPVKHSMAGGYSGDFEKTFIYMVQDIDGNFLAKNAQPKYQRLERGMYRKGTQETGHFDSGGNFILMSTETPKVTFC